MSQSPKDHNGHDSRCSTNQTNHNKKVGIMPSDHREQRPLTRGKTELLILSARHRPPPSIEYIDVSGERIKPTSSARNIGVIFDEHMSLDKHVTNICKAFFFHLRNISKIRDRLSQADTEKLVHAFITSKLDSANSLLHGLPTSLIDRLQNVQNAAASIITRTKK